jgi:hypothetical protein
MKTAGRENQERYTNALASRVNGTEGENNPAQWGGLDVQKNSGHGRSVFPLTPFIELIRSCPSSVADGPNEIRFLLESVKYRMGIPKHILLLYFRLASF